MPSLGQYCNVFSISQKRNTRRKLAIPASFVTSSHNTLQCRVTTALQMPTEHIPSISHNPKDSNVWRIAQNVSIHERYPGPRQENDSPNVREVPQRYAAIMNPHPASFKSLMNSRTNGQSSSHRRQRGLYRSPLFLSNGKRKTRRRHGMTHELSDHAITDMMIEPCHLRTTSCSSY